MLILIKYQFTHMDYSSTSQVIACILLLVQESWRDGANTFRISSISFLDIHDNSNTLMFIVFLIYLPCIISFAATYRIIIHITFDIFADSVSTDNIQKCLWQLVRVPRSCDQHQTPTSLCYRRIATYVFSCVPSHMENSVIQEA